MTSSRFLLIFLGFILVIIVILTSRQIGGALRERFSRFLPAFKVATQTPTLTPTPEVLEEPTPTSTSIPVVYGRGITPDRVDATPPSQIPATGPQALGWLILGGSLIAGLYLRR